MVFGIGKVNSVLPENIEQHIDDGYKLIDVREEHEWNAGHHPDAIHAVSYTHLTLPTTPYV